MATASKRPYDDRDTTEGKSGWLKHYVPLLAWLPTYQWNLLPMDLIAGATVWAMTIPEGVAYAQLAGVPPQVALFAAPFLLIAYALFGTSRQMMVGATSACSIMLAATVAPLAGGDANKYLAMIITVTLLVGVITVVLGMLRLGFVKNFLSESVLTGFVFGLALVIAIGQVPKLFGLERVDGNFFEKLWQVISHLGSTNGWTLMVGAISLALLFALERFMPRIPAALVACVLGIALVYILNLRAHNVAVVGNIPTGLPVPGFPSMGLHDVLALLPGTLGIVVVVYAEHIGAASKFASKYHYDIDANQELIALGTSNFLAGLFQGMAGGGSLSRSTVNDVAGARSQLSGLVAAVLVLITLLFLTPLFAALPEATLGAIVIHAVWGLFDSKELSRYWKLRRTDFVLALVALLGVLIFDILPGLLLAVTLSLLLLVYRASRPAGSVLGKVPGKPTYGSVERHPENETIGELLIFRLDAPLFFANDSMLKDRIKQLARTAVPHPKTVLLDMEMSDELDIASLDTLTELVADLKAEGVKLELANVRGPIRDMLKQGGFVKAVGDGHVYASIEEGVEAFRLSRAGG